MQVISKALREGNRSFTLNSLLYKEIKGRMNDNINEKGGYYGE
jgi:hypothetical protein